MVLVQHVPDHLITADDVQAKMYLVQLHGMSVMSGFHVGTGLHQCFDVLYLKCGGQELLNMVHMFVIAICLFCCAFHVMHTTPHIYLCAILP